MSKLDSSRQQVDTPIAYGDDGRRASRRPGVASSSGGVSPAGNASHRGFGITYGRARLVLGIAGVGFWVVVAVTLLFIGASSSLAETTGPSLAPNVVALLALVVAYVTLHAGFDLFGGYLLPTRFGRRSISFAAFGAEWARGVAMHGGALFVIALAMLFGSRALGAAGMALVGAGASMILLAARRPFAAAVARLKIAPTKSSVSDDVVVVHSHDIGFTGGVDGLFRVRRQLIPEHWVHRLNDVELSLALQRRREAARSGLWLRGRVVATLFTWVGMVMAATLVSAPAGSAGVVLQFALIFSLWSFFGLLVLPTMSRRASRAVDALVQEQGASVERVEALAGKLDRMQDDEPARPGWVEAVFHPIPSVNSRGTPVQRSTWAAWDAARMAAFLSLAGLGLLGRAVHCNSGRPALWVYLPSD